MLNSAQLPNVTGSLHVRVRKRVNSNQGLNLRSGVIHIFSSCGYFGTGGHRCAQHCGSENEHS